MTYPKNRPNQKSDDRLITRYQLTPCIETYIFEQWVIANQEMDKYETAGNYKITPLTGQS